MEDEAVSGVSIPLSNVVQRVCKATGLNKNTIAQIKKEGAEIENGNEKVFDAK